jgi:gamma-glutamyl:cysteine ligase YbdK (ATP-grasp superfamily)
MKLGLFEGYGVELEYMIVDQDTLDVRPVADAVLKDAEGNPVSDVVNGAIGWSNELVAHVIELKTEGPAPSLNGLAAAFQENVNQINATLAGVGARLLPTAAHPWMDPLRETTLWAHEYNEVYLAYDRIFGCKGHGWSNLQSTHINLPFANDDQFGRLNAAIRLVLPLIPALAASSPILDGLPTGLLDTRLDCYQGNQRRIPSIIGRIIPEPVYTQADYQREIFERTYRDIAPFDPEGLLQHEFLNSRGAIARFSRGAIEIRLVDIQECPAADLAIVQFLTTLVRALVEEQFLPFDQQRTFDTEELRTILLAGVRDGEAAVINNPAYLAQLGVAGTSATAGEVLAHLADALRVRELFPESQRPLDIVLREGTLSRRILRALHGDRSRVALKDVYRRLAQSLAEGTSFIPH